MYSFFFKDVSQMYEFSYFLKWEVNLGCFLSDSGIKVVVFLIKLNQFGLILVNLANLVEYSSCLF